MNIETLEYKICVVKVVRFLHSALVSSFAVKRGGMTYKLKYVEL
jgi:hypothetical protein